MRRRDRGLEIQDRHGRSQRYSILGEAAATYNVFTIQQLHLLQLVRHRIRCSKLELKMSLSKAPHLWFLTSPAVQMGPCSLQYTYCLTLKFMQRQHEHSSRMMLTWVSHLCCQMCPKHRLYLHVHTIFLRDDAICSVSGPTVERCGDDPAGQPLQIHIGKAGQLRADNGLSRAERFSTYRSEPPSRSVRWRRCIHGCLSTHKRQVKDAMQSAREYKIW